MNKLSKTTRYAASLGPRHARHLLCLLLLSMLAGGWNVQAATVNGLYDGIVRVKDRSEATRSTAFVAALRVVLTKVSGRSDAPARVGAALNNAARYVQRYSYLATGQLEVGFESAAINNLLDQAGLPLWEPERPTTLVVYPQALQELREARMATEQTAKLRGVPIVWANGEISEQFPATGLPQLQALARRYDAAAVLVARPGVDASAANLRWQMVFNNGAQELMGSAEDGPNLAAEVLGRYYAAGAGKDGMQLMMDVSGMDNLDAYAMTLSYLNGLLMVRGVAVESLQRDVLRVRLELRGNQEALRRALTIDQKLVEIPAAAPDASASPSAPTSASALTYRYQP